MKEGKSGTKFMSLSFKPKQAPTPALAASPADEDDLADW
jgi:hypothetical protein